MPPHDPGASCARVGNGVDGAVAKILLIEDQRFITQIFTIVLKSAGHTIVPADSVIAGANLFASEHPEVVLTDVMLPDGCGLALMRKLRAIKAVPFVVFSAGGANAQGDYLDQARRDGAVAALQKPVASDELLAAVNQALNLSA
jgi:DNA-binding NtrC family response regulator